VLYCKNVARHSSWLKSWRLGTGFTGHLLLLFYAFFTFAAQKTV